MKIEGQITFVEDDGVTIATVEFPSIDVRFHFGARDPAEVRRAIMDMVATAEQVGDTLRAHGRFDWEAAAGDPRAG
jgi:hypothetical protein